MVNEVSSKSNGIDISLPLINAINLVKCGGMYHVLNLLGMKTLNGGKMGLEL